MSFPTPTTTAEERLDAAQQEWERQDRMRRVVLVALRLQIARAERLNASFFGPTEAPLLVAALEDIAGTLSGDWIKSPQEMAAQRAAGEGG